MPRPEVLPESPTPRAGEGYPLMKGMLRINRWDFNLFIFRGDPGIIFSWIRVEFSPIFSRKRSGLSDAGRIKLARKGLRAEFSPLGGEWMGRKGKEEK
jgi:hypothetical protein